MKWVSILGIVAWVLAGAATAAEPPAGSGDMHPRDANTPVRASTAADDVKVTAQIRQALDSDQTLSTSGKHIQIVTNSSAVVLKGAVRAQEPSRIESLVQQYAGIRQVINQLTVADPQPAQ
ncbi:MAG: BON domain-containing protein [Steroidobacteraceae bacterium]